MTATVVGGVLARCSGKSCLESLAVATSSAGTACSLRWILEGLADPVAHVDDTLGMPDGVDQLPRNGAARDLASDGDGPDITVTSYA